MNRFISMKKTACRLVSLSVIFVILAAPCAYAEEEQTDYSSYAYEFLNFEDAVLTESYVSEYLTDLIPGLDAYAAYSLTRNLQNGTTGEDVKAIQERLSALGYDAGPADGIFGSLTQEAVLQFQKDHALYADGIVGNMSMEVLNHLSADTEEVPQTVTVPEAWTGFSRSLSYGSQGSDVTAIQTLLKDLGYDVGGIDGVFGNLTMNAVRQFQQDHQLDADGIIGPLTAAKLNIRQEAASQEPEQPAESADAALEWIPDSVIAGAISAERILGRGMTGDDISNLQQRLFNLGYLESTPTGSFNAETEAAVKAFQEDHALYVDGLAGNQTITALNWKHRLDKPVVSELADSAVLTEKCYSREGNPIRFIIPHHMAGRSTGQACAEYFTNNTVGTSANYCIGYGGDIAQNVPEQYGAWTSGDVNFDRRAVTIEVSDTAGNDYRIPQEAQDSFVDLCVDIVKRNPSLGGKLVYDPDDEDRVIAVKNGTADWNTIRGNVLIHCWTTTAGTTCPEWHMKEILPGLVAKVNSRLQQAQ